MRRRNSAEEISCQPEAVRNICARGLGQVLMAWSRLEGSVPELMSDQPLYLSEKLRANARKMACHGAFVQRGRA